MYGFAHQKVFFYALFLGGKVWQGDWNGVILNG